MLATPWPAAFSDADWLYEIKWDGVRLLLFWDGTRALLRTRRGRDATETYPELGGFTAPRPCVLDGEIVALDDTGRPSFERLQQRMNVTEVRRSSELAGSIPLSYVLFDVLYEGDDLTAQPLAERRERLEGLELAAPCVVSDVVPGEGEDLFAFVTANQLEGMVAKRRSSRYQPGARSADWRKVPYRRQVKAVVGGFTLGDGSRSGTFGSLLVGLATTGGLRWIGAVGSGFPDSTLRAVRDALDLQTIDRCPFVEPPLVAAPAVWVDPRLVAVVEFKEWTRAGRLRAPVFKGLSNADPDDVTWEAEGPV